MRPAENGPTSAGASSTKSLLLDALTPLGQADLVADYVMPVSAHALHALTGLVNTRWQDMDACSQAMIDGITKYVGDPVIEARCRAAAGIVACITERIRFPRTPDQSLLALMLRAGMPEFSVQANIKFSISGGQNEPHDVITGAGWALLAVRRTLTRSIVYVPLLEFAWCSAVASGEIVRPKRVGHKPTLASLWFGAIQRAAPPSGASERWRAVATGFDELSDPGCAGLIVVNVIPSSLLK